MDTEIRAWKECRVESTDGKRLNGYAIVFDSLSEDLGGFRERIAPEAVDRAIGEGADVRALVDHDAGKVIGRTRSGTLQLRKDSRGLRVVIEPDVEISYAKDIMRAVARGDISGMSFGFGVIEESWDWEPQIPVRTIHDMRLAEVSVVAWPAYTATKVNTETAVRSMRSSRYPNVRTRDYYERRLRLAR